MKVLLRAPLLSLSGYGIHSRQVFEWLESIPNIQLDVEIVQWGRTCWLVNPEMEDGLVGRIVKHANQKENKILYDYSFQVQLPDEWDVSLARKNIGITALVETDRCNPHWVECCNRMDAVIFPSKFTKNVAKVSGLLTTPTFVIPEWYNDSIDNLKENKNIPLELDNNFNFLLVGTTTSPNPQDDRKNIYNSIKWFCEAFKGNKNIGLIVKTSFGKGTQIDRELSFDNLSNIVKSVREGDFPRVNFLHGNMTKKDVAKLYKHPKIKCLLTATKGEGYGLPLIEAAASDLPIIATGWSGHTDFLDEKFYSKVDYTLENISQSRHDNRIFFPGARWAKVNEKDFKSKMKKVAYKYKNYEKKAIEMGINIRKDFCKEAVIEKYNLFFEDIKNK